MLFNYNFLKEDKAALASPELVTAQPQLVYFILRAIINKLAQMQETRYSPSWYVMGWGVQPLKGDGLNQANQINLA